MIVKTCVIDIGNITLIVKITVEGMEPECIITRGGTIRELFSKLLAA